MCGTTKATARWSRSIARCGRQSRRAGRRAPACSRLSGCSRPCGSGSAVWTGSAASAAVAGQSPARVKYYVVPAAGHGSVGLFRIAELTLGDGSRYMQIFRLNKGRLQRNGGRLENPKLVEPGWVLELPKDAAGAGVHFGPLPRAAPAAGSAPPSHHRQPRRRRLLRRHCQPRRRRHRSLPVPPRQPRSRRSDLSSRVWPW